MPSPPSPDHVIEARWVIPVVPSGAVLEHHAVLLRAGGVIALMPVADARASHPACTPR